MVSRVDDAYPQPSDSLSRQPQIVEHQAPSRRCPLCAEVVLAQALRCKHCGASLTPPSRALIRVAQVTCGFESALFLLVGIAVWAIPTEGIDRSIQVLTTVGCVIYGGLFSISLGAAHGHSWQWAYLILFVF